jgi:hypothetical protein
MNHPEQFARSRELRGCSVALVELDGFVARYLQAVLEQQGAIVTNAKGSVEDIIAVVLAARPPPSVAVVDARLWGNCQITELFGRSGTPFLLVAHGSTALPCPEVPLWQWPFGAFQIVEALSELLDANGGHISPADR